MRFPTEYIVIAAHAGGVPTFGASDAHVAVDPATAVPQKYPHMGTVVPSGIVAVVGFAIRLICCWPNAATAAKRRNALATSAAFNVALQLKSLIRIMVLASRCRSVLDIKSEFVNLHSCLPSVGHGPSKAGKPPAPIAIRQ
jgi:hypothetical protein